MKYEIGRKIRYYRELQGMNQKEFSAKIGVSNSRVSNWEQGINRPDADILATICQVLQVSADDLLDIQISCTQPKESASADSEADVGLRRIYENYTALNQEGRDKLIDYSDDLVSSGRYIKTNTTGALEKQA